jgi:valyl-tRNA synthetase
MICVFNDDGSMTSDCGQFAGLMRFECRRLMLEKMKEMGCYRDTKPNPGQKLPLSQRTGDVIEPMLKPQWWVASKDMATKAADAVRAPALYPPPSTLHPPANMLSCYFIHIHRNARCAGAPGRHGNQTRHFQRHVVPVARQHQGLVHQPAAVVGPPHSCMVRAAAAELYNRFLVLNSLSLNCLLRYVLFDGEGNGIPLEENFERWIVADNEAEARQRALAKFPGEASLKLIQDEDVLDTWFSSGLFPFSTLGWPNTEHPDFKAFYPNTILETGHDILFFWVARMVMMGMTLTGQVPFKTVFLHAMVRDKEGRKMSKSLGNVIDPMWVLEGISLADMQATLDNSNLDPKEVDKAKKGMAEQFPKGIPQCGVDALRFGLAALVPPSAPSALFLPSFCPLFVHQLIRCADTCCQARATSTSTFCAWKATAISATRFGMRQSSLWATWAMPMSLLPSSPRAPI